MPKGKFILGATLGECVHVAGILSFLQLARENGYETTFLGAALAVDEIAQAIRRLDPGLVAISYRLSPETGEIWLRRLSQLIEKEGLREGRIYAFGGTEPVAKIARRLGFFDVVFGGGASTEDVIAFLQKREVNEREEYHATTLLGRIAQRYPYPVIRHHFGLPSFEETLEGVRRIAEAEVLDIISLATDQDAQENFLHPDRQDPSRMGAGGVPVRTAEQLRMLYEASRCGNHPLMRVYAGTDDLIEMAQIYLDTINNCFAAIPIFWFNRIDRRGPMELRQAIEVHMEAIRWHAERDIPVEINDPHHWSLRGAHDAIYVADSFLCAHIAKKLGVKDYVMQMMFDTPSRTSFKMDLAKMLAAVEMVEELQDENFTVHRETRAGLMSFPNDPDMAKGQLASSVMLQMALNPEILHVVGYCEGDHAATPDEVIESCRIAQRVVENALRGMPDMTADPEVQHRKEELKREAGVILEAIRELGEGRSDDPLLDPENLANVVRFGFLDAPQLIPSKDAQGKLVTQIIDGACYAVDQNGRILSEKERVGRIWSRVKDITGFSPYTPR
jgi:hypothetical protein